MIYFTSDLHLGHRAVLDMQERPFAEVREMNEAIIRGINECVGENDTLYLLGDVTFRCPIEEANAMIARIHGKKILIRGNHDRGYDPGLFVDRYDFLELCVNGLSISLMHYPMAEWPKSRHGGIHLHGHQHNSFAYNLAQRALGIRRYDVGVDAHNYRPVALPDILAFMGVTETRESKNQ